MQTLAKKVLLLAGACLTAGAGCRTALGEDAQLRSRAVSLMDQAAVVSRIQGGPYNIRTEVSFSATASDGSLQGGTYTRVKGTDGGLREDLQFGAYSASRISIETQTGWTKAWNDPPYGARAVLHMIPFSPGRFDESDVIQSIKDGLYGGRQAQCVVFETIVGERRLPGEVCLDKANGTLLELRSGNRLYEYSEYFSIKGGLFPGQIVYRNGNFSLNITLKMFSLEERPDEAFAIPGDWTQGSLCKQWQMPVAKVAPQPPGEGAPDAPVTDVGVHLHVGATGRVNSAEVLRQIRPDLDAEAVKVTGNWIFEPGTCDGHAQDYVVDVMVHFQGWRVKDPSP